MTGVEAVPKNHMLRGMSKKRNKALLETLAEHNRRLTPASAILAGLGIGGGELNFLHELGRLADGRHPHGVLEKIPGDPARLAALGLIYIGKSGEISLSDAGRFLLVLTFQEYAG
jgi:hypothetical protein